MFVPRIFIMQTLDRTHLLNSFILNRTTASLAPIPRIKGVIIAVDVGCLTIAIVIILYAVRLILISVGHHVRV